jgi:hypothetical protein
MKKAKFIFGADEGELYYVRLYSINGKLIKDFGTMVGDDVGAIRLEWDYKDSEEKEVLPGKYYFELTSNSVTNKFYFVIKSVIGKILYRSSDGIKGEMPVEGYAGGIDFEKYIIDFGKGLNPEKWETIVISDKPVDNGILGIWDTGYEFEGCGGRKSKYPGHGLLGIYSLRLRVYNKKGEVYTNHRWFKISSIISSIKGGVALSDDEKFKIEFPPHGIKEDYKLVSICDIDTIPDEEKKNSTSPQWYKISK